MRISRNRWFLYYFVGVQAIFFLVFVVNSASGKSGWCREPPTKRKWRFPPPPPPPRPSVSKFVKTPPLQLFRFHTPPARQPGRPLLFLFKHNNHNGFRYEQYVGPRCYNLPNIINDQASSLNTNGRCVKVCKDRDCKRCRKMKPGSIGHFKLAEVGMDDEITSVTPCEDILEHA